MKRSKRSFSVRPRNCRNSRPLSRAQKETLAEELEQQWREIRRHATIERDTDKLLWLAAAVARRKRRAPGLTTGQSDLPGI